MNNKSIDFVTKAQRKQNWELAKKLALQLDPGRIKRCKSASPGMTPSTYTAACLDNGLHVVIGDSMDDIPRPTQFINGRPAMVVKLNTKIVL